MIKIISINTYDTVKYIDFIIDNNQCTLIFDYKISKTTMYYGMLMRLSKTNTINDSYSIPILLDDNENNIQNTIDKFNKLIQLI